MSDDAVRRLEEALLGGERTLTREDVREAAGMPQSVTERLWRALGFPDIEPGVAAFTENDVEALQGLAALDLGGEDDELALRAVRSLGQATSRLAHEHVRLTMSVDKASGVEPGSVEAVDRAAAMLPAAERLLTYAYRRHLAAAVGGALAEEAEDRVTQAVLFADLVGFTSLTRQLSGGELEQLVERFEGQAADRIARHGGRLVKTLGDEVMVTCPDAATAAALALETVEAHAEDDELPDVRVGIAVGPVLQRAGDVYGEPVNVAARLTSLARPGTVLVDREGADVLGDAEGYVVKHLSGRISVRGYGHLQVSVLRRASSSG